MIFCLGRSYHQGSLFAWCISKLAQFELELKPRHQILNILQPWLELTIPNRKMPKIRVDYYLGIYVPVNGLYQWFVCFNCELVKGLEQKIFLKLSISFPLLGLAQQKTHNFIYWELPSILSDKNLFPIWIKYNSNNKTRGSLPSQTSR